MFFNILPINGISSSQQRQSWNNVARGWQKWWKTFEKDVQKVNERLVEPAGIKQGDRVIDITTDIGEPAITAAKTIVEYWNGANSKDLLIDISYLMPHNTTMMTTTTTVLLLLLLRHNGHYQ